jgi:hypothetical protein
MVTEGLIMAPFIYAVSVKIIEPDSDESLYALTYEAFMMEYYALLDATRM